MIAMTTSNSMSVKADDATEADFTEGNEDKEGNHKAGEVRL
jgi:hypothetical protein